MKNLFIYTSIVLALSACSREKFAEYNTDPDAILAIDPRTQFPTAALALHSNDFEAYYDYNRNINNWTLMWVQPGGNAATFRQNIISTSSTALYRYEDLYTRETSGAGGAMINMQKIIDNMPEDKKATYAHVKAIAGVPLAYAGFYVSDIIGSIAYSNAFQARYTVPPNITPTYDSQEALYELLNTQLKDIVATLTANTANQVLLGTSDVYFNGVGDEASNWAKAANSLRLKIAMRMLKRKPDEAKAIINDVLSGATGVINSRSEQWVFRGANGLGGGGNWDPGTPSLEKNMVDFLYAKNDPRLRMLLQVSPITQSMFLAAQAQGKIPVTEVWRPYVGRYASPDAAKDPAKTMYVTNITFKNTAGRDTTLSYPSTIQSSLWNPAYQNKNAIRSFPVITYADICFMRAELAVRGITSENAEDWYNKGIDASMADYDAWGSDAKVNGYTAISAGEVDAYKNMPGIKYSAATGLEQICLQQYINFYNNPNEMWALMKRTAYPSTTGAVFQAENITSNGTVQPLPRRWALALPTSSDINYSNKKQAIEDMQKDPDFGNDLSDITGRIWWDKK